MLLCTADIGVVVALIVLPTGVPQKIASSDKHSGNKDSLHSVFLSVSGKNEPPVIGSNRWCKLAPGFHDMRMPLELAVTRQWPNAAFSRWAGLMIRAHCPSMPVLFTASSRRPNASIAWATIHSTSFTTEIQIWRPADT